MRHLFSTRIRVILIIALLLAAGLTLLSSVTGQSIPDMVVQTIVTPLKSGANTLTKQAEQYYSYMFEYEALKAENELLKAQISQIEDDARKAAAVERENQRLREALDLTSVHEDY